MYAGGSDLEIDAIPHVVSFSFPKEQLPQVHKILEKIYKAISRKTHSVTPIGSLFHECIDYTEEADLKKYYNSCFLPIAKIFRTQMNRYLRSDDAQLPELSFKVGVPGAYVAAEKFFEVCQQPMLIHRDSGYIVNPTVHSSNDFTLIVSENFAVDQSEDEQILVGTSVYSQYGKNPVHIVAKQPGEITVVMISQHSMHSTSHECIPEPFKSNPSGYAVKRAIFQGYFTGPDLDQIDWNEVAKITGAKYSQARYEMLKTQLNTLYYQARLEYYSKVNVCDHRQKFPHQTVAKKLEEQFKELKQEELVPSLENYNIYQYLAIKREMSEFNDAFVAALNATISREAVSEQIKHDTSRVEILEAHEVMPSPLIDFSLVSLKHIHFLLFHLGIAKFDPIIGITSACYGSNNHKPAAVVVQKKLPSDHMPPERTDFKPKNNLQHHDDDCFNLEDNC